MVHEYARRQRQNIRYTLDKGWKREMPGMYQRRYSPEVYGTVLHRPEGDWEWMVYVRGGETIASGRFARTSVEARKEANNAWNGYWQSLGRWPPSEDPYWHTH